MGVLYSAYWGDKPKQNRVTVFYTPSAGKKKSKKDKKRKTIQQPVKRTLEKSQYDWYIKSKSWRARCRRFYKRYGKECQSCGAKKNIHMHHMSYERMGMEEDGDLAPLCVSCHVEFHTQNGTQTNMISQTVQFILDKRESLGLD